MSNLKVGDRVRHFRGYKAEILGIHNGWKGEKYLRVKTEERGNNAIWSLSNVKPIVTVRG